MCLEHGSVKKLTLKATNFRSTGIPYYVLCSVFYVLCLSTLTVSSLEPQGPWRVPPLSRSLSLPPSNSSEFSDGKGQNNELK